MTPAERADRYAQLECEPLNGREIIFMTAARESAFRIVGAERRRFVQAAARARASRPDYPPLARADHIIAELERILGEWLESWPVSGRPN
jgi:hypothetical protein